MRPTREMRPRPILSSGLGGTLAGSGTSTFEDNDDYYTATTINGAFAELGAGMRGFLVHDASDGDPISFETGHHQVNLDADYTIDFTDAVSGRSYWTVVDFVGDGTPRVVDYTGSTVEWATDALDHPGTLDEAVRVVYSTTDGGTNVVAGVWGGSGGSALTVEDEGTPLATAATTLDFVGAGVAASGTGAKKTIAIEGVTEANVQAVGHYEVLMNGASPPEPLENGSGTDWLYVWVPG